MNLGKVGVFALTDGLSAAECASFAQKVEAWGYGTLWVPEALTGRNALVQSGWLLANTQRLVVGTGIAVIYGRDAVAMTGAQMALAESSGGRFALGIGVSHGRSIEKVRGHAYDPKPVALMRDYVNAMRAVRYAGPPPAQQPPLLLAALGPKMTALAGEVADGAIAYNSTPAHTAEARRILGPGKLLCVELKVLPAASISEARAQGRSLSAGYFALPNYVNNWRRIGYGDEDFADGGSDRLIDDLFAWGDRIAVAARISAHVAAGADHVYLNAQSPGDPKARPDLALLEKLRPA